MAWLMLLPLGVKAQGAKSYELVIEKTNGQTLRLPISSDGQISVGYEDVIVRLGSETLFLTMDDIAKMYAEKTRPRPDRRPVRLEGQYGSDICRPLRKSATQRESHQPHDHDFNNVAACRDLHRKDILW